MREEKISQESFNLVQKELVTLTEKMDVMCALLKELEDLKLEIKGLKLFLGRVYPEFSKQFPVIMKKVSKK